MIDKVYKLVASVALLALLVGLGVYFLSGESQRKLTPLMEQLVRSAAADLSERLPRVREVDNVLLLIPARSPRSEELQFRALMADAVYDSGKYRVQTWDQIKKTFDDDSLWTRFLTQVGMGPGEEPTTLQQAIKVITRLHETAGLDVDGVLFVDVTRFSEGADKSGLGAEVAVQATIYSVVKKAVVGEVEPIQHGVTSAWDLRYLRHTISQVNWLGRFFLWFVVAAGMPWGGIQVVRMVVRRRNNQANLLLLGLLTLLDLVLAWVLLVSMAAPGAGMFVALLVVALAMGYYNYDACDYIQRRLL